MVRLRGDMNVNLSEIEISWCLYQTINIVKKAR